MRTLFLIVFFQSLVTICIGQSVSKRLVYQCRDSTVWNAENIFVNNPNDFLIEKRSGDTVYFINSKEKPAPFKRIGSRGSILRYQYFTDSINWYYRHKTSQLFGPVKGQDLITFKHPMSDNEMFFAVPVLDNDSIYIYLNDKLMAKTDTLTSSIWNIEFKVASQLKSKSTSISSGYDRWIQLSDNGNAIYSVENNLLYRLYINGILKDSSKEAFSNLLINNNGSFVYGGYRKYPVADSLKYFYTVFTKDSVFKTGGYFNDRYIGDNGEYYLSGVKNNKRFILINNRQIENLDDIENIRFGNNRHFLFMHKTDSIPYINIDGTSYKTDKYKQVYYPVIDSNANYAYYGLRDFYLYKIVNGKEVSKPLSKYGVRAYPLYINAAGRSTHIFITDDSTYIYQDDKLLAGPASNHTDSIFISEVYYPFFDRSYSKLDEPREDQRLVLLTINDSSYMIYEGGISRPMIRVELQKYGIEKRIGEIVCSEINRKGFFLIQKTGPRSFLININNRIYKEVSGVDYIFEQYAAFDGKTIVFNGIIDKSLYQFTFNQ